MLGHLLRRAAPLLRARGSHDAFHHTLRSSYVLARCRTTETVASAASLPFLRGGAPPFSRNTVIAAPLVHRRVSAVANGGSSLAASPALPPGTPTSTSSSAEVQQWLSWFGKSKEYSDDKIARLQKAFDVSGKDLLRFSEDNCSTFCERQGLVAAIGVSVYREIHAEPTTPEAICAFVKQYPANPIVLSSRSPRATAERIPFVDRLEQQCEMLANTAKRLSKIQQSLTESLDLQQVRSCQMLGSIGGMGIGKTRLTQELLPTIRSCNEKLFDNVSSINTLREWMASDPICVNLYTCIGNGTPLTQPTFDVSPQDYVSRAVAYRALQDYFRLDSSFLREAEKRMPNLTLSNALRAIVQDARGRSAAGNNNNNSNKMLVVLTIDELQLGLAGENESAQNRRSFLRHLIGELMADMSHSEPFFLVPMVTGLSYTNIKLLINEDSTIPINNLVPRLLTQEGMWHAVRTMYPSSFAASMPIEEMPREFRSILAYIGGYPRGFEMWLASVDSLMKEPQSSEWTDALGTKLSNQLDTAINHLPKSRTSEQSVLEPLFRNLIWAAMRNRVIDLSEEVDSSEPALRGITWDKVTDVSGFALTAQDDKQRLEVPAMVVAAWLDYVKKVDKGKSHAIEALRPLLALFTHVNWNEFEVQTANYVAFLLAVPEAGTSISLAKLLFPFSLQQSVNGSIFSSLKVIVPEYSSYRVSQLSGAFPCRFLKKGSAKPNKAIDYEIFNKRRVVLNTPKAPFSDSLVVLRVSDQSRTVEALGKLPFFDSSGRSLDQVVEQTQEEIDLVVCFQNKHSARGETALSATEIEKEWDKNVMAANKSVGRFPRPFVLTMVVVSNRRGARGSALPNKRGSQQHHNAPPSNAVDLQHLKAETVSKPADSVLTSKLLALPRPYVVVARTTEELSEEGFVVVPVDEFFPKPLMPLINVHQ